MIKKIYDNKGKEFPSIAAMLRFYDISESVYYRKIKEGYTLEDILESRANIRKKCTDHKGNEFASINDMCKAYGVTTNVLCNRMKIGWSLKDSLTKPVQHRNSLGIKDHLGQEFASMKEMAKYYGLRENLIRDRLAAGFSIKDTLTTPVKTYIKRINRRVTDHTGREFPTVVAMCEYYHIDPKTYYARSKLGWSQKDVLEKPLRVCARSKYEINNSIDKDVKVTPKKAKTKAKHTTNIKLIKTRYGDAYNVILVTAINGILRKIDLGRYPNNKTAQEVLDKALSLESQYKDDKLLEEIKVLKIEFNQYVGYIPKNKVGYIPKNKVRPKNAYIRTYISKKKGLTYFITTSIAGKRIYIGNIRSLEEANTIADKLYELRKTSSGSELADILKKVKPHTTKVTACGGN